MEPKPESLWWTSTHKHEDMRTLRVGTETELGISCFVKSLKCWDTAFIGTGRDSKHTMCTGLGSG